MVVEEKVASFAAALMAGVADKYGGDPDHLQAESATMPDHQGSQRRRRFLVLYDTLPGGTGYLHRLADPGQMRDVLMRARAIVAGCQCAGENKRACHRCLLSHVRDEVWEHVSRATALEMLDDLQEAWDTDAVPSTCEISLWDQVESELEARFLKVLEDWARQSAGDVSLVRGGVVNGRKVADLRISLPAGGVPAARRRADGSRRLPRRVRAARLAYREHACRRRAQAGAEAGALAAVRRGYQGTGHAGDHLARRPQPVPAAGACSLTTSTFSPRMWW